MNFMNIFEFYLENPLIGELDELPANIDEVATADSRADVLAAALTSTFLVDSTLLERNLQHAQHRHYRRRTYRQSPSGIHFLSREERAGRGCGGSLHERRDQGLH